MPNFAPNVAFSSPRHQTLQLIPPSPKAGEAPRRLSHPYGLAIALDATSMHHQYRRESKETLEKAATAVKLCAEQEYPHIEASSLILQGWAEVMLGGADITRIRRGMKAFRSSGFKAMLPELLLILAEACLRLDRFDEGLAAIDEALGLANETGIELWDSELHRMRGELLLASGDEKAPAQRCFTQAVDIARKQQAKSFELRAAASLRVLAAKTKTPDQEGDPTEDDRNGDARDNLMGMAK